jgi:LacI family transcriptional regulator
MITIKKIAKIANVSPGTVDRIINNRGRVSQENRDKVNALIKEYGYVKNIFARNLVLNKKYKIAVVILERDGFPYWDLPLNGIKKAATELSSYGVKVDYFFFKYDLKSFNNITTKVLELDHDGLVFAPVFYDESVSFLNEYKKKNIPIVIIDSDIEEVEGITYVGQDSFKTGYLAAKLISYGVKDESNVLIFNITSNIENTSKTVFNLKKIEGFYSFFKDNKSNLPKYNFTEIYVKDTQKNSIKIEMFTGIDCVFVLNSRVHIVAKFIKENNLKNIRVIGYDLLKQNLDYLNEGFIDFLIHQKPEKQGYLGIKQLYNKIVSPNDLEKKNNYVFAEIIVKENSNF